MDGGLLSLIIGLTFLETLAQFLSRKYKDNKEKLWMFVLAVFCYIGIVYILIKSYDLENIGFVNGLWSGTALIAVALVGYLFFDEKFGTMEYLAFGLIFSGTVTLALAKQQTNLLTSLINY